MLIMNFVLLKKFGLGCFDIWLRTIIMIFFNALAGNYKHIFYKNRNIIKSKHRKIKVNYSV